MYSHISSGLDSPRVGGHEGIGEIIRLGGQVGKSILEVGSRVGMGSCLRLAGHVT
jgi:D-arabinose 1-dehydrogenase-like Zn-dependent alcohol dehydrogenase